MMRNKELIIHVLHSLYLKRLTSAFYNIWRESEVELMRAYCNSLWKWKLANEKSK